LLIEKNIMAALFGKTGQNLIKIFGDDVAQQAAKATLAGVVTGGAGAITNSVVADIVDNPQHTLSSGVVNVDNLAAFLTTDTRAAEMAAEKVPLACSKCQLDVCRQANRDHMLLMKKVGCKGGSCGLTIDKRRRKKAKCTKGVKFVKVVTSKKRTCKKPKRKSRKCKKCVA
jgi:hypothetical protein